MRPPAAPILVPDTGVRRPLPHAGGRGRRKEKATDQLDPAGAFDVALTVERAAPPPTTDDTPELAFTGAPLLVLIALLMVLVASGFNLLASARRRKV